MFDWAKHALAESYVGAIGFGYLFAQGILHCVNIFASPIAGWVSKAIWALVPSATAPAAGLPLEAALPELIRFFLLLLIWFFLLRWLYVKPSKHETSEPVANP